MKQRVAVKKISDKRLAQHGGRLPWSSIANTGKPIKKVNPERVAKRRVRYREGMAAYKRSATCKIVKARAAGRCEAAMRWTVRHIEGGTITELVEIRDGREWEANGEFVRCANRDRLADHHTTYARFGGNELPDDICKSCPRCHDYFESQHPTRRHGR